MELLANPPAVEIAPMDQPTVQQEPVNSPVRKRGRRQKATLITPPSAWFPRARRQRPNNRGPPVRGGVRNAPHGARNAPFRREIIHMNPPIPYVSIQKRIQRPRQLSPSSYALTSKVAAIYLDSPIPPDVIRSDLLKTFHLYLLNVVRAPDADLRARFMESIADKVLDRPIYSILEQLDQGWIDWASEYTVGRRIYNWLGMDPSWINHFLKLPRIPYRE